MSIELAIFLISSFFLVLAFVSFVESVVDYIVNKDDTEE